METTLIYTSRHGWRRGLFGVEISHRLEDVQDDLPSSCHRNIVQPWANTDAGSRFGLQDLIDQSQTAK